MQLSPIRVTVNDPAVVMAPQRDEDMMMSLPTAYVYSTILRVCHKRTAALQ
jgi:hypothetical protein